ncbi:uncharacterized [Tachysurus ichikawai]
MLGWAECVSPHNKAELKGGALRLTSASLTALDRLLENGRMDGWMDLGAASPPSTDGRQDQRFITRRPERPRVSLSRCSDVQ